MFFFFFLLLFFLVEKTIFMFLDVSEHNDPKHEKIIEKIVEVLGDPRNYGPTPEEKEEMERTAAELKMRKESEERVEREKQEAEEEAELKQKQEKWVGVLIFFKIYFSSFGADVEY